jgi:hypothetical protein
VAREIPLRLFALLLPGAGDQVAEFGDTLVDFDGHSMRLIEMRNSRIIEYGIYCIGRFCGMYLGKKRLSMSRESLEWGDLCFDCVLILL